MKFYLVIILFFTVSVVLGQADAKDKNYKPVNLEEAVEQLKTVHHDTTKQKILAMTENEFLSTAHRSLGRWMRNDWGLWKGKELAQYFNSIGIYHPDDMSAIILASYYRELHGQDWKVDEQVKFYQDFWAKSNEHFYRLETDTAYQRMIKSQQDSLKSAQLEQKKREWTKGKHVTGSIGYQCGFFGLGKRTKIEGTILEWQDDHLLIYIDHYFDEKKKKRAVKCNNVENDRILIEHHYLFHLEEN